MLQLYFTCIVCLLLARPYSLQVVGCGVIKVDGEAVVDAVFWRLIHPLDGWCVGIPCRVLNDDVEKLEACVLIRRPS